MGRPDRRKFLQQLAAVGVGLAGGYAQAGSVKAANLAKKAKVIWHMQTYATPKLARHVITPSIELFNSLAANEMFIQLHYSGHIPDKDIATALRDGSLDAFQGSDEMVAPEVDVAIFSGYFPLVCRNAIDIPALLYHWNLRQVWEEAYGEVPKITWLGAGAWDPWHIISNRPITTVDDLYGLKLFTFPGAGRFLSKLGVTPVVNFRLDMVSDALKFSDGRLDGAAWSGITESYLLDWVTEDTHCLSDKITGAWWGSYFANSRSWGKLSENLQQLFKLCMDSSHYYREHWYWSEEAKLKVKGKSGQPAIKITKMLPKDWIILKNQAYSFWDEIAATSPRRKSVIDTLHNYDDLMKKANPG